MGIKKKLKEKLTEEMESRFHMEDKYDEVIKNVKFADSPTEEEPTINADNKIIEDEDDDYEPFDAIAAIKKKSFHFWKTSICMCLLNCCGCCCNRFYDFSCCRWKVDL